MNKKLIGILLGVCGVLLAAIVLVIALRGTSANDYMSNVSRGNKYLSAGEYDKAISAFSKAVSIDGSRSDAYEGLAEAYLNAGFENMALDTLRNGVNRTGSAMLELQLGEYENMLNVLYPSPEPAADAEPAAEAPAATAAPEEPDQAPAAVTVSGRVYDGETMVKLSGVTVAIYTPGNDLAGSFTSDTYGAYSVQLAPGVDYTFLASVEGYPEYRKVVYVRTEDMTFDVYLGEEPERISTPAPTEEPTPEPTSASTPAPTAEPTPAPTPEPTPAPTPEPTEEPMPALTVTVTGIISNAMDGEGVSGAYVKVIDGQGRYVSDATTSSDGSYSLRVYAGGEFTFWLSKSGYIDTSFELSAPAGSTELTGNFSMTPELSGDAIRIVLTWGESPNDLDSHLEGTSSDGTSIHVYWSSKHSGSDIAELDYDDTTSYGPETITIYDVNGTYDYYVHDYTESGTMSSSGAVVTVYQGSRVLQTVSICGGCDNYWNVLHISGGSVSVVNTPG